MSHLAGFIAAQDIDDFIKAYFEYKSTQAQKIVEQPSKTGKPKKLPRNIHKGGGYVRPLEERKVADFEGIERPKG